MYTHTLREMFGSDFGEPYRSIQQVYENADHCRLFSTAWRTSVSSLGVVCLVYKVQRALSVWCSLYIHSLIELFGSDFREPYKSVQAVYEHAFCCRLFAMALWTSERGL